MATRTGLPNVAGGSREPRLSTVSAPEKRRAFCAVVRARARRRCQATTASVRRATVATNATPPANDRHRPGERSGCTIVDLHARHLDPTREETLEEHGLVAFTRPDHRRPAALPHLVGHVAPDGENERHDERDENDRGEQNVDGHGRLRYGR